MNGGLAGYRVTKQIGVGARSRIFLAIHAKTGERFALKRVVRKSPDDDPFVRQVETEYEVGSSIRDANVRRVLDIHRVRKVLQLKEIFLVMELVNGLPLEKALPNRLNTFIKVFRAVASGLDAMHTAGYVHSDIKPHNIMIGRGGVVKIIDLGQACPIGHRKERIQGTPDFIAPEQVQRMPLDQRTDVFNLGATMYWILTGTGIWTKLQGPETHGRIMRKGNRELKAPIELNDKIPRPLSNLVMDCCRSAPVDRPGDMKQVIARLAVVHKLWNNYRGEIRRRMSPGEDATPGEASASALAGDRTESNGEFALGPDGDAPNATGEESE